MGQCIPTHFIPSRLLIHHLMVFTQDSSLPFLTTLAIPALRTRVCKHILENILFTPLSIWARAMRTDNCALNFSVAALGFPAWRCPLHLNNDYVLIFPPPPMLIVCFYSCHASIHEIVSHCRFNRFPGCSQMSTRHLCIFIGEIYSSLLPPFNWAVLLLNCGSFLYILDVFLSNIWSANTLFLYMSCLSTLVSFDAHEFWIFISTLSTLPLLFSPFYPSLSHFFPFPFPLPLPLFSPLLFLPFFSFPLSFFHLLLDIKANKSLPKPM